MGAKKLLSPRPDRAFAFATASHLDCISYAVPIRSLAVNQAAVNRIEQLKPRVRRLLSVAAAFHKQSKAGFRGFASNYHAIASTVRRVTGERFGYSLCKLAISEAMAEGMIVNVGYDTERTVRDSGGHFRPRTIETAKGRTIAARVPILALTADAVALWSLERRPRASGAAEKGGQVTRSPSRDDEKESSQFLTDSVTSKQRLTPLVITNDDLSSDRRSSNRTRHKRETVSPSRDGERVTCPPFSAAPDARGGKKTTCEHPASTTPDHRSPGDTDSKQRTGKNSLKKGFAVSLGCSIPRYPRPSKDAPETWENGRRELLADLHTALNKFSTRQADCLFMRAKYETSPDYPQHWTPCLNWSYWILRWRDLPLKKSQRIIYKTILPAVMARVLPSQRQPVPGFSATVHAARVREPFKNLRKEFLKMRDSDLAKISKRILEKIGESSAADHILNEE